MSKTNIDKSSVLRRYIRREGQPIGVVVAVSPSNIGYSLCNTEAGDHFSKEKAISKAIGRAVSQKICDYKFWERVILNKVSSDKCKNPVKVSSDFLERETGDESFDFGRVRDKEISVLPALKYMERKAKEYSFN